MLASAYLSSFSNPPTNLKTPPQTTDHQLFSMFVCNPYSTSSSPSNHRQISTAVMRTRGCNRLLLSHSGLSNSALHLINLFCYFYLSYRSALFYTLIILQILSYHIITYYHHHHHLINTLRIVPLCSLSAL